MPSGLDINIRNELWISGFAADNDREDIADISEWMFVGIAVGVPEVSGRGSAASLRNSGMFKVRGGEGSADRRCAGRLSRLVDCDCTTCRAALQGTITVFATDGQRSVVAAAMFWIAGDGGLAPSSENRSNRNKTLCTHRQPTCVERHLYPQPHAIRRSLGCGRYKVVSSRLDGGVGMKIEKE